MILYEVIGGEQDGRPVWLLLRCELGVATVLHSFATPDEAEQALTAVRAEGEPALKQWGNAEMSRCGAAVRLPGDQASPSTEDRP